MSGPKKLVLVYAATAALGRAVEVADELRAQGHAARVRDLGYLDPTGVEPCDEVLVVGNPQTAKALRELYPDVPVEAVAPDAAEPMDEEKTAKAAPKKPGARRT